MPENSILCVGLSCLDIVSECQKYPTEDEKIGTVTKHNRCVSQRWQRGGNASNNCTVLGMLGCTPTLFCTLAKSPERHFLVEDMVEYGINKDHIVCHDGCQCPSSVVLCSLETGTRTIVHSSQNLPEIRLEDFEKLPLEDFSWIHFEGRNVENVRNMQQWLSTKQRGGVITVSVELEQSNVDLRQVSKHVDVVFASKDYAKMLGYNDMDTAVEGIAKKASVRWKTVIVAWGEKGACGLSCGGERVSSPAFPPEEGVVDSLGAGDTFIAATIFALNKKLPLQDCLTFGCRVAGLKVGLKGWAKLKKELPKQPWLKDVLG